MKNQEASKSATNVVTMDSRKFLADINSSKQSQIKFFESAIKTLGSHQNADWKLTALLDQRLIIEDATNGGYLVADYNKLKGGKVNINNIRKVDITEKKKEQIFESACRELIDAIGVDDHAAINAAFNKIAASRFRSKVVPPSGVVRTRDGVVRFIDVKGDTMSEEKRSDLANRIVSALTDRVALTGDGAILEGVFIEGGKKFVFPLSELAHRKVIAWNMKKQAESAYWNQNFQNIVESIASHICKKELKEAVDVAAKFCQEYQEFCMLNEEQTFGLVNNALAARGCFNEDLVSDTATLFRKTNLKINRDAIVESWTKTANKTENPILIENAQILKEVEENDFAETYEHFLESVFCEAVGVGGDLSTQALINGLKLLKDTLGEGDEPTKDEVDELIKGLETQPDSDRIYEAMELLAQVKADLGELSSMDDFDEIPGMEDDLGMGDETEGDVADIGGAGEVDTSLETGAEKGAAAGTTINIYTGSGAPEVNEVGAESVGAEPEGDLFDLDVEESEELPAEGGEEGLPPLGEEGEEGLPPLGEEGAEGEEGEEGEEKEIDVKDLLSTGLEREGNTLAEGEMPAALKAHQFKKKNKKVDSAKAEGEAEGEGESAEEKEEVSESYALKGLDLALAKLDADYKSPETIDEEQKLDDPPTPEERRIGKQIKKAVPQLKNKKPEEAAEAAEAVAAAEMSPSEKRDPNKVAKTASKALEVAVEDQYKSPVKQLARRGLKKAAVQKLVEESKLQWLDRAVDGVLGEFGGVQFVLDHADPPVILSVDGTIEIPIPEGLIPGALTVSEVVEEDNDADEFVEWLVENIEQLRPITESDNKSIDEAVASIKADSVTITATPDGQVEVAAGEGDAIADIADGMEEPGELPELPEEPVTEPVVDTAGEAAEEAEEEAAEAAVEAAVEETPETPEVPETPEAEAGEEAEAAEEAAPEAAEEEKEEAAEEEAEEESVAEEKEEAKPVKEDHDIGAPDAKQATGNKRENPKEAKLGKPKATKPKVTKETTGKPSAKTKSVTPKNKGGLAK